MKTLRTCLAVLLVLAGESNAQALPLGVFRRPAFDFNAVNRTLKGRVLDFTYNNGVDRRICSAALGEKRDLYVYVPPGYDPRQRYPFIMYLHGISQDEKHFLHVVDVLDSAIASGKVPPVVIAAPDGSIRGKPSMFNGGSFFVNSRAGRFEDYIMQDVWNFMHEQFSIRPEREAHVMVGASMGGFGAYNLSFKYRERIGSIAGLLPPLNLRYLDCHGRYFGPFDPDCLGWRERLHPNAPIAKYYHGLVVIREKRLTRPLFGRSSDALARIAAENPVEMLETYNIKPGEFEMFVAYAGKDEFNINSQVESFVFYARGRGITVTSVCLPNGHHNVKTGKEMLPYLISWLAPRLSPEPAAAPR